MQPMDLIKAIEEPIMQTATPGTLEKRTQRRNPKTQGISAYSDNGYTVISGYASVFSIPVDNGDIIHPGAFAKSIRVKTPKMLYEHDPGEPIGAWTSIREDDYGLWAEGVIEPLTNRGMHAAACVEKSW